MRERKRQFHLSLGIAVCICLLLPLSVLAGEYAGTPAAEGSGISAMDSPWQAALCEPCTVNADCDADLLCGSAIGGGTDRCIPDTVPVGDTYECSAGDSGSGCLIDTVANGFRMAE
ncbi:MAG TPA: hypothetical protein VMW89_16660 [Desulfatiglandales bacterium]|nr:hypothetical protein [Desulfatiglandales bacterium]